jgi:hypothetical protein
MILLHRYAEDVVPARRGSSGTQTVTRTQAECSDADRPASLGTRTLTEARTEAADRDYGVHAAIIPKSGDPDPHQRR